MSDALSELDIRLVAALRVEPRATVLSLAESTGFPRAVVASRLKELQGSGELRIVGATHPLLSGTNLVAVISIGVNGPITPVLDSLRLIEESVYIATVTGPFELVMEVRVADQDALLQLLDFIRSNPLVEKIETLTYGKVVKGYLSQRSPAPVTIDDKDGQLIDALGRDGRKSWQELADFVGLSPSAVRTRVNRLLDAGALRIVVMERGGLLGRVISIGVNLTLSGDSEAILREIIQEVEVEFAITAIGKCDAVLVVRAHSHEALFDSLERIRSFPGVTKAETRTVLQQVKEEFARLL